MRRRREAAAAASEELRAAVVAADAAGVPRSTIIRLSGVARQTVYDWLTDD